MIWCTSLVCTSLLYFTLCQQIILFLTNIMVVFLGNRDMPQSVPKQKKKAQQYKGQKKSE